MSTMIEPIRWKGEDVRPVTECFACGRAYSRGDGRFCTSRCRDAYDAGLPAYGSAPAGTGRWRVVAGPILTGQELHLATLHFQPKGAGVEIQCRGCHKLFISKGLRCCSTECEHKYRERQDIAATMVEAGMEPLSAKRKCSECGRDIPRYVGTGRKRRLVNSTRLTCSPKCQRKAGKQSGSQTAALVAGGTREVPAKRGFQMSRATTEHPENPPVLFGPDTAPLNVIGGHRVPGASAIDLAEPQFTEAA